MKFMLVGLAYLAVVSAMSLDEDTLPQLEDEIERRIENLEQRQQNENTLMMLEDEIENRIETLKQRQQDVEESDELEDMDQTERQLSLEPIDIIKVPILPVQPIRNASTCCNRNVAYVDLRGGRVYNGVGSGVEVKVKPTPQSGAAGECSMQALLKVNFEKLTRTPCPLTDGCVYGPYCGRRMLRVDMLLSSHPRSGFLFNIGDSQSNNGYKGDSGHQQNDAEIDGRYPYVRVWSSDVCGTSPSQLALYNDALLSGNVSLVTMYISDKHVRITNNNGLDEALCHRCLFALNGQTDTGSVGPNQDIYIALNRVVAGTLSRSGEGLCAARLSWMCPF